MRLAFSSLVALAVAATQVSGRASYRLHNRDTVDVCAQLDALLEVPEEFAGTIPIGLLSVCLCISGIPDFLEINPVAVAAVVVAGVPATTAAITALINTAATHTSCTFPDQAAPSCTSS
ncbi:hypothetical protein BC835DRAFT_1416227 [Cytidiella melzeri]|nr:hypothetical protein BC835DRAFT_1416227 [Cytidiella melzeri]